MVIDKDLTKLHASPNSLNQIPQIPKRKWSSNPLFDLTEKRNQKKKNYQYKFHDLYMCTRKSQHLLQSFALSFQNYVIRINHKNNLDRVIDFSYLSSIYIRTWHWQIINPFPVPHIFSSTKHHPPTNQWI